MSHYTGANITEIRIFDDPADPDNSDYKVALPVTVFDAVVEQGTGATLADIIPHFELLTAAELTAGASTEKRVVNAANLYAAIRTIVQSMLDTSGNGDI